MAKLSLVAGTTSKTLKIFVQDSSVTTGAGLTGLTNASGSLTGYYVREGANAAASISIVSATLGTWTSGGFIVVDGTNMPGLYEIGIPDAAIAAGAKSVVVMYKGATNMAPVVLEIELTAVDNQTATNFGLSALPTANPGAAGGVFIAGTNAPVTITGSGNALTLTSTGGNGKGLAATGNGTGDGITATSGSGSTGNGATFVSAATAGSGLQATGSGTGNGLGLTAGASGNPNTPVTTSYTIKKNTLFNNFEFQMVLASDHVSPATGLSPTVQRSIDGGAYADCTNTPATGISNGTYKINLSAADLNGNMITLKCSAATADTTYISIVTQT